MEIKFLVGLVNNYRKIEKNILKKVVLAKITPLRANKDVNMVNAVLNNVTNVDSTARILAGTLAITESY